MTVEQVAQVCHEANAAFCRTIGDNSQKSWNDAEEWQRQSAIRGVNFSIDNPTAKASSQHDAWMADKVAEGWKYGPSKDATLKQHPCIVPYHMLPKDQQTKDHLFRAIVAAFVASD